MLLEVEELIESLIEDHRKKIFKHARDIVPKITPDDILQVNDFPILEENPFFRYEEGILEGLLTVKMAFLAWKKDKQRKQ